GRRVVAANAIASHKPFRPDAPRSGGGTMEAVPAVPLRRGDVVYVDLKGAIGVEKQKTRPCVVVQNDGGNRASPMTIVAPITDEDQFKGYAQQVLVEAHELGP